MVQDGDGTIGMDQDGDGISVGADFMVLTGATLTGAIIFTAHRITIIIMQDIMEDTIDPRTIEEIDIVLIIEVRDTPTPQELEEIIMRDQEQDQIITEIVEVEDIQEIQM